MGVGLFGSTFNGECGTEHETPHQTVWETSGGLTVQQAEFKIIFMCGVPQTSSGKKNMPHHDHAGDPSFPLSAPLGLADAVCMVVQHVTEEAFILC